MKKSRILGGTGLASAVLSVASAAMAASEDAPWGYAGSEGPEHWGDLSPAYETCGAGRMQSPIDLAEAKIVADVAVDVDYAPLPLTVLNNGYTVQFDVDNGSAIETYGKKYKLLQVHFHTPSEHVLGGSSYPLEAHFVHKAEDDTLAVIGIFLEEGAENAALSGLLGQLPTQEAEAETFDDVTVDPRAILPAEPSFYRYMGSLTTPPCSEAVNWFVAEQVMEISADQIQALEKAMRNNARPPQPLNNRLVIEPE